MQCILFFFIFFRKRKPSGEPSRERRVVKMMWDEDPQTTSDLLDDMGVSLLSDEESLEEPHPTPPAPIQSNTLPQVTIISSV